VIALVLEVTFNSMNRMSFTSELKDCSSWQLHLEIKNIGYQLFQLENTVCYNNQDEAISFAFAFIGHMLKLLKNILYFAIGFLACILTIGISKNLNQFTRDIFCLIFVNIANTILALTSPIFRSLNTRENGYRDQHPWTNIIDHEILKITWDRNNESNWGECLLIQNLPISHIDKKVIEHTQYFFSNIRKKIPVNKIDLDSYMRL
jgi:hypothetical protein